MSRPTRKPFDIVDDVLRLIAADSSDRTSVEEAVYRVDGCTPELIASAIRHGHLIDEGDGFLGAPVRSTQPPAVRHVDERPVKAPRSVPKPAGQYSTEVGQNEHLWSILNSDLPAKVRHTAMALNAFLGKNRAFTQRKPVMVSTSLLVDLTGLSEKTVRRATADAVRAGYFHRVDNGRGGRQSANGATYVPTLPASTRVQPKTEPDVPF